ncbi:MAG: RNA polymerase-associated protein RapA [Candidatus Sericytochromatia bacterium]
MFAIGQRWISETEPEMGLGTVLSADQRFVEIVFPASGTYRKYALRHAPLIRVRFKPGDKLQDRDGNPFTVEQVQENAALITYIGNGNHVTETDLSDKLSFSAPEERLLSGQTDDNEMFKLRYECLLYDNRLKASDLKGFIGPRLSLIPHQFYIAHEVTQRHFPRVLLADEVGLGKTMEACLIINRLLLSERIGRVLIVTPEPLVNQWFVEIFRKFNLIFTIVDDAFCQSIKGSRPDVNPFLESQLILCSLPFLISSPLRMGQVLKGDWDLLAVDEAHHLVWETAHVSPEYRLIQTLARKTPALLLLTATPEQLGVESHFARLQLLDPDRFYDFETFVRESGEYAQIAETVQALLEQGKISPPQEHRLIQKLGDSPALRQQLHEINAGNTEEIKKLLEMLVDQHGTSRVFFRNNRSAMPDFPVRRAVPVPLKAPKGFHALDTEASLKHNPKVDWLVKLIRQLKHEKILLICHSKSTVVALKDLVRTQINVKTTLFHEGLSLIARDRNAAYFAEEDGARVLFCSEIGSEGRNFQFAHHLVLFDLPLNPDLLEQRIGRLDRIGQQADIKIYIPYIQDSAQEVLFKIYHQGLNAFEAFLKGGMTVFNQFTSQITTALANPLEFLADDSHKLAQLIEKIQQQKQALYLKLEKGRDQILEYHSFRPEIGQSLVSRIAEKDQDPTLENFMNKIFAYFGVECEEISERTYFISPSSLTLLEHFPGLPDDGTLITYSRQQALEREDITFLSWEHPMVVGLIDILLASEQGNASMGLIQDGQEKMLLLEAVYVLESVAPKTLHAERFMPPTMVRVLLNQHLEEDDTNLEALNPKIENFPPERLADQPEVFKLLKLMLEKSSEVSEARAENLIEACLEKMNRTLAYEAQRLRDLKKVNPNVRAEEIAFAQAQLVSLNEHIRASRLRLDSLRVIFRNLYSA